MSKIANFVEFLEELTAKTKYGFKDIHTLRLSPQFKQNVCNMFDGILYDSKDCHNRAVKYASVYKDGSIHVQKYWGVYKEDDCVEPDEQVLVKVVDTDKIETYLQVEAVGINDGRFIYKLRDGKYDLHTYIK